MKKHLLLVYAFNAILLTASPSFAANPFGTPAPAPAPAAINIYDWYNLGENVGAATNFYFNVTVYEQMDDTYKQVYDLMVKAHLSDGTISAFKQWYPILKALPWDKDWSTWTKEQQDTWKSSQVAGAWFKGVSDDAGKAVESVFFYWLGRHIISVAWSVPYYLSQGWTDDAKAEIVSAAKDFLDFSTNSTYSAIFSALTPDVQNAMTFIAAAKKKATGAVSPFDKSGAQAGLSPDDMAKIVDAAKQIRAAAQANQLTK
jgi:hypothetical protein